MRLALTSIALVVTAVVLLAGCGGGDETTSAPEPVRGAGAAGAPIGASVKKCGTAIALTGRLGDGVGGLRVSRGVSCETGAAVMSSWITSGCITARGESRSACTVRRYRCLAVRVDRGLAVSCARRGRSISFVLNK